MNILKNGRDEGEIMVNFTRRWFFPCIVGLDHLMVFLKAWLDILGSQLDVRLVAGCSKAAWRKITLWQLRVLGYYYDTITMVSLLGGLIVNILEGPGATSASGSTDSALDAKNINDEHDQFNPMMSVKLELSSQCTRKILFRMARLRNVLLGPTSSNKDEGSIIFSQRKVVLDAACVNMSRKFPLDSFRHQKFFEKIDPQSISAQCFSRSSWLMAAASSGSPCCSLRGHQMSWKPVNDMMLGQQRGNNVCPFRGRGPGHLQVQRVLKLQHGRVSLGRIDLGLLFGVSENLKKFNLILFHPSSVVGVVFFHHAGNKMALLKRNLGCHPESTFCSLSIPWLTGLRRPTLSQTLFCDAGLFEDAFTLWMKTYTLVPMATGILMQLLVAVLACVGVVRMEWNEWEAGYCSRWKLNREEVVEVAI